MACWCSGGRLRGQPAVVDLTDVVRDATRILPPLVGDRRRHPRDRAGEPVVVEAHRSQLERVVINLAVNGGDAMPDGGPLEIAVGSTIDSTTGEPEAVLTVTDAGLGMDAGTSDRIFEPYFTTKGEPRHRPRPGHRGADRRPARRPRLGGSHPARARRSRFTCPKPA